MAPRILLSLLIVAVASSGQENWWPQYRGPGGTGIAESGAPVEFGPSLRMQWGVETLAGHSSPSVWGDHLFLTSFDDSTNKLELTAFDRNNGQIRWKREIPATEVERVHADSSPATATPVTDGDRVYVYFGSAGLFCFDFDGEPVWSHPLPKAEVTYGSGTSPVLIGEALVLARDDKESHMLALERTSGGLLWDAPLGGGEQPWMGHSTPVIWNGQVVLHRSTEVAAYSLESGARLWWVNVQSEATGTPVIEDDMLYVAAWDLDSDLRDPLPSWQELLKANDADSDGAISREEIPRDLALARRRGGEQTPGAIVSLRSRFRLLDTDQSGGLSEGEWRAAPGILDMTTGPKGLLAIRLAGKGDMTTTNIVWRELRSVPEVPAPLVYGEHVYAVTHGGIITVLEKGSGSIAYRGRLGASGMYYSSPVAAAGHVYFASTEGMVTVLRAGGDLDVVARNDLGEPIYATPAIVGGRLYVRTKKHLYAFGP